MVKVYKQKQPQGSIVPLKDRPLLTIKEATEYFGIGDNTLRSLTNDTKDRTTKKTIENDFVLYVGKKRMIKREKLEDYLLNIYSV